MTEIIICKLFQLTIDTGACVSEDCVIFVQSTGIKNFKAEKYGQLETSVSSDPFLPFFFTIFLNSCDI